MKYIKLTQDQIALVDDDLFGWLDQWNWCAKWYPKYKNYYAVRTSSLKGGPRFLIPMHRQILGLDSREKLHVDHKDGNGLNNQRNNIRIATHAQNHMNTKRASHNKSGYKGVCKFKGREKYYAVIRGRYLGSFDDPALAHEAYFAAAQKEFGEFARAR